MVQWSDKYAPTRLSEFRIHKDLAMRWQPLMKSRNFPHLFIHGKSGSGVKTFLRSLLLEAFNDVVLKTTVQTKTVPGKTKGKPIGFNYLNSPVHSEFIATQCTHDIIQEIVEIQPSTAAFRVIVLHQVDQMPLREQQALRRTMEKYMQTSRFILVASNNNTSHVIQPLRSRCLAIRVPSLSDSQMRDFLQAALAHEIQSSDLGLYESLVKHTIPDIVQNAQGDLRQALLQLEQCACVTKINMPLFDWQLKLKQVLGNIVALQSISSLLQSRAPIVDVLALCAVLPDTVMQYITMQTSCTLMTDHHTIKKQIVLFRQAAKYNRRMNIGYRPEVHIEALLACILNLFI